MPKNDEPKHTFSSRQRWLGGLNSVMASFLALVVVVMLNYVAGGHLHRYYLARDAAFKLSRETSSVLGSLPNQVKITIFFQPNGGANEEVYGLTRSLLAEYQNANPGHIHVHVLDYSRLAGEAKEFLEAHKLPQIQEKDFVLIESGGHSKLIYARELSNYDFSELLSGKSKNVRRSEFKGELLFTSAIFAVCHPQALKTYFLAGHGENNPGDPKRKDDNLGNFGYSKLAAILKDEVDSDWDKLVLAGTNDVPRDCQLLIVAGPRGEFLPEEVTKIAAYLKNGGRLLALLPQPCGLDSMLAAQWGIRFGDKMVVDPSYSEGPGSFLVAKLNPHLIMDPLIKEERYPRMVWTRPVYHLEDRVKVPGAPEFSPLANTSKGGIDETQKKDEYTLIAAVEQGVIKGGDNPRASGTRIIAAGDSIFLDDQVLESWTPNHDFAELALNWLLQRPAVMLEGLVPSPIKEYRLYLTATQGARVRWLFLALMPGSILALGGLVWLRRRH